MDALQITARLKIHAGKLDEFKKLAEECYSIVKEKENEILQYDWFLNEELMECVVREKYANSNALLTHLAVISPVFPKLLAVGDFSAEVCGNPSQQLADATTGLDVKVYSFFQGL